jgi:hypothetical protein
MQPHHNNHHAAMSYPYHPHHYSGWPMENQHYPQNRRHSKKRYNKEPVFKPQDLIIEEVELDSLGRQIRVSTHFYPSTGGPRIFSEGVSAEAFAQYRADLLEAAKRTEQLQEANKKSILQYEIQQQKKLHTENERLREQLHAEIEIRKKDKLEYEARLAQVLDNFQKLKEQDRQRSARTTSLIKSQSRLGKAGSQALKLDWLGNYAAPEKLRSSDDLDDEEPGPLPQKSNLRYPTNDQQSERLGKAGTVSQSHQKPREQAYRADSYNQPVLSNDQSDPDSGAIDRRGSQISEYPEPGPPGRENQLYISGKPPSNNAPKSLKQL